MAKKKIVIVDDEPYIRLLVRSILGRDYVVLEACDGEEAVNLVRAQRPALVLMDIMMPKLDGVGACSIIKSGLVTREIPVIMLTARADELDREYSRKMGADGYITKPFCPHELLGTVNRFLVTHNRVGKS